jgi:hypothetical protein
VGAEFLFSIGALKCAVQTPHDNSGTVGSSSLALAVSRNGQDVDQDGSAKVEFSGQDLGLRIFDGMSIAGGLLPDYVLIRAPNGALWQIRVGNDGSITTMED